MDWRNPPIGMIRHDELLNALLALWKTQQSMALRNDFDEYSQGFQAGFEEGLDAVAQIAGLTDTFETSKTLYRAKIKVSLNSRIEIIKNQVSLLEGD